MKLENKVIVFNKYCKFCDRQKTTKEGKKVVFQYKTLDGKWSNGVYCTKSCFKAFETMNGGI